MPTARKTPDKPSRKKAVGARSEGDSTVKKTTDLSERVLEELRVGQQNAIEAVRRFMESTDRAMPSLGDGYSRPQEVIDSALEMSERLVEVQYDFVRNVMRSTGEVLSGSTEKS